MESNSVAASTAPIPSNPQVRFLSCHHHSMLPLSSHSLEAKADTSNPLFNSNNYSHWTSWTTVRSVNKTDQCQWESCEVDMRGIMVEYNRNWVQWWFHFNWHGNEVQVRSSNTSTRCRCGVDREFVSEVGCDSSVMKWRNVENASWNGWTWQIHLLFKWSGWFLGVDSDGMVVCYRVSRDVDCWMVRDDCDVFGVLKASPYLVPHNE